MPHTIAQPSQSAAREAPVRLLSPFFPCFSSSVGCSPAGGASGSARGPAPASSSSPSAAATAKCAVTECVTVFTPEASSAPPSDPPLNVACSCAIAARP